MSNIRIYSNNGLETVLKTETNLLETLSIVEKIDTYSVDEVYYKRSGDINYDIDNDIIEILVEED